MSTPTGAPLPALTNPRAERVRKVAQLSRRVGRERAGRFVAEGPQAVREAIAAHVSSGDVVLDLFATPDAAQRWSTELAAAHAAGLAVVLVADDVLAAMTGTVTPQGLLAVCRLLDRPLDEVLDRALAVPAERTTPLVAVLSHVRDPGNAGTVLRAADAAGAGAVVLTEASVDVHNPKCVRATAGSAFHLPVAQGPALVDVVSALRARGFVVLAADGAGEADLDELQDAAESDEGALLRRPTAWIFGNEAWGLSEEQRGLADAVVRVPLRGGAESLNLAMAATVCLYASSRAGRRLPSTRRESR
ncbi:TrmH family RNA methyltransferase [Angustibacter luteus]|uniref:TrmH family RNA methyltransferase n=1 Tax=Angustibacter luteus TaxID=658456 RepID=A0ABW1J9I6_9ACTN